MANNKSSKAIEFIFDFGSPNAYLAWKILPKFASEHGAIVRYTPALLGGIFKSTGNSPPMMAFGAVKGKLDYERVEMNRFIAKQQLSAFKFNPHFPVNTLILMRGAVAAQKQDRLDDYIAIGMEAMWERGLKMDDPDVFVTTLTEAGFDGQALLAETQNLDIKSALIENTSQAVARGVFGIPSFFIGYEMFFGKDKIYDMADFI